MPKPEGGTPRYHQELFDGLELWMNPDPRVPKGKPDDHQELLDGLRAWTELGPTVSAPASHDVEIQDTIGKEAEGTRVQATRAQATLMSKNGEPDNKI